MAQLINMNGLDTQGILKKNKECSPICIYVHCYGHVLNLALQDTMTQIEPLRNVLDSIQALYNFLEESVKWHTLFGDTDVELRWGCKSDAEVIECLVVVVPVRSREGGTRTNITHWKSSVHAVFRQRSKNLRWEKSFI